MPRKKVVKKAATYTQKEVDNIRNQHMTTQQGLLNRIAALDKSYDQVASQSYTLNQEKRNQENFVKELIFLSQVTGSITKETLMTIMVHNQIVNK